MARDREEAKMASVVLFHSVWGLRSGKLAGAEQLRATGQDVFMPDPYTGNGLLPALSGNNPCAAKSAAEVAKSDVARAYPQGQLGKPVSEDPVNSSSNHTP